MIEDSLKTRDKDKMNLALENDGRMFFSKVREHIHKEKKIFDKILFLNLARTKINP